MGDPSFHRDCPLDCKVYVGNLGNNGNKTELERAFGYYGPLRSVWVARNPPGFAFVEFEDPRDASDAVRELDGRTMCGCRVRVELSTGEKRSRSRGPPPSWSRRPRDDYRRRSPPVRRRSPKRRSLSRSRSRREDLQVMSSQSTKKKRLGSRRQAPARNAKPEDVDFNVAEGSSLAQNCKPEGNTETLVDALPNLNEFPSEIHNPPSAELTENRRKLGSSRKSKRAQHSKAVDLQHTEEAEEKNSNDQAPQATQLSVAMQPQKQEEMSQRNEPSVPAMHDNSLYSSDGYFPEPTAVTSPEAALHVLQSEQLKENTDLADVLTSVLSSPSLEVPFTNQSNPTKMPEELPQVFLADKEDSELFRLNGNLQNLVNESLLKPEVTEFLSTSGTPTIITNEGSPEVNIHLEYCDEKEVFSSRLKEFDQSEDQSERLSFQGHDAHYASEDAAKNAPKQEDNLTQMEEVNNSSESATGMLLRNQVEGAEASDSFESASKQEDSITEDTALGQINEIDRCEEDDTTPNAEQSVDQQSEGILSDSEVSSNSLQTVNSESQESDTYPNTIGSRRKIGSSRRYKEKRRAKESVAETSHTPAEDVENTRETMLEKMSQAEEIQFDQFEENTNVDTHAGITEFTTLSSLSSSPAEQQRAEGSDSREMAGDKLPHMNPVRDTHGSEGDEDVESGWHGGNLQGNYLEAASHVTLEDMAESLVTPELSTEKSEPEPGQVMSLLKEQKLPAYEGQNEIISSLEAKVDHLSNDINSGPEKAVNQTKMQEVSDSSENVFHDVPETLEMDLGILASQAEVNNSSSQSVVVSTDESAVKQEDSYPDEENEHPTEESNSQTSENTTEDYLVSVTKEIQITGLESEGTALSPIYEIEVQVQDDKILSGQQTADQEDESILSVLENNDCSSETQPSQVQPLSDSRPEQDEPNFHPTISRRKLGSSRRNKGRGQYLKESVTESANEGKEETVEMTESDDALPVTHDSSAFSEAMQSQSSEEHKPTELSNPESSVGVLVPESENVQQTHDEKHSDFGVEVSGKTEEAMLEEIDKPDTPQPEELSRESAHHSQDALNEVHDQEIDPTQETDPTQTHEGNNSLENVTHDVKDQVDWTVVDATPSELTENNMEDPAIKKEDSISDETNDLLLTEQNSHGALDQENKDYFVSGTTEVQITGVESEGTALSPVYEVEVPVQDDKVLSGQQTAHQEDESILSVLESNNCSSETQPSQVQPLSDSQPEQDEPNFHPTFSRRKLGSSRRNKGRGQYLKESVTESANEGKEETVEMTESDDALPVTHDSSAFSEAMQSQSSEEHKPTELSNPESNVGVLVPESENVQQTQDEKHSDFGIEVSGKTEEAMLEEIDKPDTPQPEEVCSESAHHSQDALNEVHDQEIDPTQTHEGNNSLENVTHDVKGQVDWTVDEATPSELTENNMEDPTIKKEDSNSYEKNVVLLTEQSSHVALDQQNYYFVPVTKEVQITGLESEATALSPVYEVEVQVQDDKILSGQQAADQEDESILSVLENNNCSSETQSSQVQPLSDSQPEQDEPNFHPTISRRKLGSSRRNKGRQQYLKESVTESANEGKEETVESTESGDALPVTHGSSAYSEVRSPNEEVVENTMDNEQLKTTKRFSTNKRVVLGKSVDMEIWVDEMSLTDSNAVEFPEQAIHIGILESTTSKSHSTTDQLQIGSSNSSEIPKDEDDNPYMTSETENESLGCTSSVTELHVGSEGLKSSVKLETSTDRHRPGEYKESECSIEQETMSTTEKQEIDHSVTSDISTGKHSPEKHTDIEPSVEQAAGLTPEQQFECANLTEAGIPPHSDDVLSLVCEDTMQPAQVEEPHQTEPSSFKESDFPLQSDVAASLDLYPQDSSEGIEQPTQISFRSIGTRRKLGSSRRNKARQHVRDANDAPENEPEVVEMAMKDESFKTTEMSFVAETARKEELIKQTEEDVMDESEVMPTNINSSLGKDDPVQSNKDNDEGAIKHIKEAQNLAKPDTLEFESLQSQDDSETQSVSYHDGNFSTISVTADVLEQGDANQIQQTEVVSYDKDSVEPEMTVQLPNNVVDTVRDTTVNDCRSEVESSTDAQVLKAGENFEKKDEEAQEMNVSETVTAAGPFGQKLDTNDASIPSAQSGIPPASSNPQEIQGQSFFNRHENLQSYTKQKKRKMGSTRRSQLKTTGQQEEAMYSQAAAPESDFTLQADVQKVKQIEMVKESPKTAVLPQDLNPKKTSADEGQQLQSSDSELRSSLVSDKDVGKVVHGIPEGSFMSSCESSQSTPQQDDRQESENVIQEQALKLTETINVVAADLKIVGSEIRGGTGEEREDVLAGTQDPNSKKSLEMTKSSPRLNSANSRRKMGSTRRNLTSRDKKEDFQQEQEIVSEVNVGDIKAETSRTKRDSEQTPQRVFETVESSYTGESYLKPPSAHSFEASPVSHDQLVETEPPVPSITPSTSPKHDVVTEAAAGGRRRKLGSHRRSRRSPSDENQTAHGDRTVDTQGVVHETGIKTTEEEPVALDRIPETGESSQQPTSITSTPVAAAHLKAEGAEAPVRVSPVKQTSANIRLVQDSQQAFSLGAAPKSNIYHVLVVGDSSVGKTSFMRRAQSGKFAVDLPASVGLDSCRWTVVVDGKPVVLQLWDTAGQERFHSITRQVFHKAQAFILMYDITSCQSFSAISYWADCIQEGAAENVTILLVGNKSDRPERQVKALEGENIAKEYNFEFMECSAATGENVIECLETVARMLSQRVDTRVDSTVLHNEPQQKKSSGCC
ncbi:uncharacterized protein V6R79_002961 [Siganus canaliculatus]